MRSISVVIVSQDSARLLGLPTPADILFLKVAIVNVPANVRDTIARCRAELAIIDLELITFSDFAALCHEFPDTAFISTHRLADDELWAQSLASGAIDCCRNADLLAVISAAERYVAMKSVQTAPAA